MRHIVPSDDLPDALSAMRAAARDAVSIRAAVAFVTESGADQLVAVIREGSQAPLAVCARGAPITEQSALLRLRDELEADVTLVMGSEAAQFHPKLWLIRSTATLTVISGSGNLTAGGLVSNAEQFEVLQYPVDSEATEDHEARFEHLTSTGLPLGEVEKSPAWYEWTSQANARSQLARRLAELDDRLASRKAGGREEDKRLLCEDLYALYERTVAAKLPRADGRAYVPNYFKRGLDAACGANNPVPFVSRICRDQTEGFDVILAAGVRDLTVETLVVDEAKPYHDLFDETTLRRSEERLRQFSSEI
jgi:HKD family nuclease